MIFRRFFQQMLAADDQDQEDQAILRRHLGESRPEGLSEEARRIHEEALENIRLAQMPSPFHDPTRKVPAPEIRVNRSEEEEEPEAVDPVAPVPVAPPVFVPVVSVSGADADANAEYLEYGLVVRPPVTTFTDDVLKAVRLLVDRLGTQVVVALRWMNVDYAAEMIWVGASVVPPDGVEVPLTHDVIEALAVLRLWSSGDPIHPIISTSFQGTDPWDPDDLQTVLSRTNR